MIYGTYAPVAGHNRPRLISEAPYLQPALFVCSQLCGIHAARARGRSSLKRPVNGALMQRAAHSTFADFLRLYYPKREMPTRVTDYLAKWMERVSEVRLAQQDWQRLEADAALIEKLDEDGNGTISMSEFLTLAKTMGLPKSEMRERFRAADLGNRGELSIAQMGAVLGELKQRTSRREQNGIDIDGSEQASFRRRGEGVRGRSMP